MKREIKFRGKCSRQSKYAGQWVYGNLVVPEEIQGDEVMIVKALSDDASCTYHVDVNSVGQFTGLTDKKGREIYEGDIIQLQGKESKFNCFVGWNIDLGAWCISIEDKHVGVKPLGEWLCEDKFEVIGNIYDNANLLED